VKISLKYVVSAAALTLPFWFVGVAEATPVYMSTCSFSPSSITLAPGGSQVVNLTADAGGAWGVPSFNGSPIAGGGPAPLGTNGVTPMTITYDNISNFVGSAEGTYVLALTPTDGTSQLSATAMCSLTVQLELASTTTTTSVPPVTLPSTGSNSGSLVAGGLVLVLLGGLSRLMGLWGLRRRDLAALGHQ